MFRIGGDRVGIVTKIQEVDGDNNPVFSDYGEPVYTDEPLVELVDDCLFEVQTPSEQQNLTVTTSAIAWVFLPVADAAVPLVGGGSKPVADITSSLTLRSPAGVDYVMRGDAVLEQDIRGRGDHVFCVCEHEAG